MDHYHSLDHTSSWSNDDLKLVIQGTENMELLPSRFQSVTVKRLKFLAHSELSKHRKCYLIF